MASQKVEINIYAEPEKDPKPTSPPRGAADAFYEPTALTEKGPYGRAIKPGVEKLAKAYKADDKATSKSFRDAAGVFYDLDMDPQTAARLHGIYTQHLLDRPDKATVGKWVEKSKKMIEEKYGKEAPQKVKAARDYIKSKPVLHRALDLTGLGSHPEMVEALIDHIWRGKSNGKLRD